MRLATPMLTVIMSLSLPYSATAASLGAEQKEVFTSSIDLKVSRLKLKLDDNQVDGFFYRLGGDYFLRRKLAVSLGYSLMPASGLTRPFVGGFDLGLKAFPFSYPVASRREINGTTLTNWSTFSHYVAIGYRSYDLNLPSSQVGLSGFGIAVGANWHLPQWRVLPSSTRCYLAAEAGYDTLATADDQSLTGNLISVIFGVSW